MKDSLAALLEKLQRGEYEIVGQVPPNADVVGRLKTWLERYDSVQVASSPHVQRRGS
jgi:hypothetical protein